MALTKVSYSMINGALANVLDYGADPTGVADSSAAFQAAVNANFGKQIRIPAGTYRINSTIQMDVTGLGARTSVCQFYGDGMSKTIIDNQTSGPAFFVTSGTGADFALNFLLKDLSIISTGPSANTIGVRMDGCYFATLDNVGIFGMASHGVYGVSTIGDFTDTAQIELRQCKIESCGGYGVYAKSNTGAIQYAWNLYLCGIGLNNLGGILYEGMINAEVSYCGIYYNNNFGMRIAHGTGTPVTPKLIHIDHCEFDTNDGVQIDLPQANGVMITTPYLIANVVLSATFTKGIVVGAQCSNIVIEQASPRLDPSLTGLTVMQFDSGCLDIAVRDTNYSGYSVLNGQMYVNNAGSEVFIDDAASRLSHITGTWTVEVKNLTGTVTSATTKTGYYTRIGNVVTATFRNLDSIVTSGFAGSDIVVVTLPLPCKIADVGSSGSCVLTTYTGTDNIIPVVGSGSDTAIFMRQNSGTFLTASNLTTGVSSIKYFTLTYITA